MYIFLDVDGVLNTKTDWRKFYSLNPKCLVEFTEFLKMLENPKIILSSSWRNGVARDGSMSIHMEELVDVLAKVGIGTIDVTGISPDGYRNKEIEYYLKRHPRDRYVILDDDISLFELREKTMGLYVVNPETGFTAKDRKVLIRKFI